MKIFISHIMEETALALSFKDWIESSFGGQCDVFLSCDREDLPAGTEWLDQLEAVFGETIIFIVLCSPASISRPWITFEMGCGWIKRLPILVLCHSQLKKERLPLPFFRFQTLELEDPAFIGDFLEILASRLGFKRTPRIDQTLMHKELSDAASIPTVAAIGQNQLDPSNLQRLPQVALDILRHLAQSTAPIPAKQLAGSFSLPEDRTTLFLDTLCQAKLVTRGQILGAPSIYTINAGGKKYLSSLGLFPG
jgi:hypothetical protein